MTKDGKKTGGRVKGTPNKATAEIKAAAQLHGIDAINALVEILKNGENEPARISAANSLLDRGYGKPTQAVEHSGPDGELVAPLRIEIVAPGNDN